jgi:hypothetical protein
LVTRTNQPKYIKFDFHTCQWHANALLVRNVIPESKEGYSLTGVVLKLTIPMLRAKCSDGELVFRRIQMVRPAGAAFVIPAPGGQEAEPLDRRDKFLGPSLNHVTDAGLRHLEAATSSCTVYDAPLNLQQIYSGTSSPGCKAQMPENGCPHLSPRLIRHRIDHTHRLPGDAPPGAAISPYIRPIGQFYG